MKTVLHIDMDAFFVSVELRRRPGLVGRPVIVGGAGERGVVAAASYEARVYGIRSAMPSVRARRLCPHAVFLSGDHRHYAAVSARLQKIFLDFTPQVEPIALDEAFLDITGAIRAHGSVQRLATRLRDRIRDEEHLESSVGVGPSKLVAKLASEAAKPQVDGSGIKPGPGVVVVDPDQVASFMRPLPVRALWGVGPKTGEKLRRYGVDTVGDLADLPLSIVRSAVGEAHGQRLHALANGIDDRPVEVDRPAKSISHEETFSVDHHDHEVLRTELIRMVDSVVERLRESGLRARTVFLKARYRSFITVTRADTMVRATDSPRVIGRHACQLLDQLDLGDGIRLLGVGVGSLAEQANDQLSLDELMGDEADSGTETQDQTLRWDQAYGAVDEIRSRFGHNAIAPAVLVEGKQVRVKRRGQAQWGPDGEGALGDTR